MTRDECPSILGTVALSGRPFVASGSTAKLREWMRVGLVEIEGETILPRAKRVPVEGKKGRAGSNEVAA